MNLAKLIRGKNESVAVATAIPAISAIHGQERGVTIARIATIAVASPTSEKTAPPAKVSPGNTATASRWWLIHYPDRDPLEVACCPEATHSDILERHPDAVAAEPFTPTIRQPSAPLTAKDETAIRAWLALIEETDPATIAEVIGQCQRDADAREYFTGRAAAELPKPDPWRVTRCCDCTAFHRRTDHPHLGHCAKGVPEAMVGLWDTDSRRCEGYAPGAADADRRPGRERWPGLTDTKGTK